MSNEFLFPTFADYNDSNGRAYVCGHKSTDGCDSGVYVVVTGEHYWKDNRYGNIGVYRCSTSGGNAWASIDISSLPVCDSTATFTKIASLQNVDVWAPSNTFVRNGATVLHAASKDICITEQSTQVQQPPHNSQPQKTQEQKDCEAAAARGEPANWNGSSCNCGNKHVWDKSKKACIAKQASSSANSCINSRPTPEGKACCLVPSSVATWDGSKCNCVDPNKEFINGACVSKQPQGNSGTATFSCSQADLIQLYAWLEQYASNAQIVTLVNQILEFCTNDDNRSQIEFNRMMAQLRALIAQNTLAMDQANCNRIPGAQWNALTNECKCLDPNKELNAARTACVESSASAALRITQEQKQSRNEITGAVSKIKSLQDSFKKTVWKNEDGKFNTSRLASDLTAAVVLGTTGALVTSNVIKKNQVNNGFDDISCTIGGQRVADWGDQFRVGVK